MDKPLWLIHTMKLPGDERNELLIHKEMVRLKLVTRGEKPTWKGNTRVEDVRCPQSSCPCRAFRGDKARQ